MTKIYIAESDIGKGDEEKKRFVRGCLASYLSAGGAGCSLGFDSCIDCKKDFKRMPGGKPYIPGCPLFFSLSNSGGITGCAVGARNIGFDLQEHRDMDFLRLAGRFYTDDEKAFVIEHGKEGFFSIWSRKEALIKCTGRGLSQGLSSFGTVENGKLLESVKLRCAGSGLLYLIREIKTKDGFSAAICEETRADGYKF